MATIDPDGGDVAGASSPKKNLKSIRCPAPDYPGDHYLDRDQIVEEEEDEEEEDEEEEEEEEDYECDEYLEGPSRRAATLAKLKFYQPLAEKALTYYNSKECTNLLLKEVLVTEEEYVPETVVFMNFVARSEDDSKLFYFFAKLKNGPYPKCRDVNEKRRPVQNKDFHVIDLCSLETHDSDYLQTFASRCWRSDVIYPQGYGKYWKMRIS